MAIIEHRPMLWISTSGREWVPAEAALCNCEPREQLTQHEPWGVRSSLQQRSIRARRCPLISEHEALWVQSVTAKSYRIFEMRRYSGIVDRSVVGRYARMHSLFATRSANPRCLRAARGPCAVKEQPRAGVTSLSLLERAKNDDGDAWQRIVELYAPLISIWCKHDHKLPDDVSDEITQEVLTQLLKSLPAYQAQSFRGFLRTMTRNKVVDWIRREQRHEAQGAGGTTALRGVAQLADPYCDDDVSDHPTPSEQALLVRKAFEQLESRFDSTTIEVVKLVWIEGQRVKDVAEQHGMTQSAVSGRLKRVKQALAVELDGILDL